MKVEIVYDIVIRQLISKDYGLKFIDCLYRYNKRKEMDATFTVPIYSVYYMAEVVDKELFMLFQLEYPDYIVKIYE